MNRPEIAIVSGSTYDLLYMHEAPKLLDTFGLPYLMEIVEVHKNPQSIVRFIEKIHDVGIKVIIAGSSGAAHLPGMLAAYTPLPVIGVPIKAEHSIDGLDAIYSILQMPEGIPVATMGLNNAYNAALFALQILGCREKSYWELVAAYKKRLEEEADTSNNKLQALGFAPIVKSLRKKLNHSEE